MPAHQRQPVPAPHRNMAQTPIRKLPKALVVVLAHQCIPALPLARQRHPNLHLGHPDGPTVELACHADLVTHRARKPAPCLITIPSDPCSWRAIALHEHSGSIAGRGVTGTLEYALGTTSRLDHPTDANSSNLFGFRSGLGAKIRPNRRGQEISSAPATGGYQRLTSETGNAFVATTGSSPAFTLTGLRAGRDADGRAGERAKGAPAGLDRNRRRPRALPPRQPACRRRNADSAYLHPRPDRSPPTRPRPLARPAAPPSPSCATLPSTRINAREPVPKLLVIHPPNLQGRTGCYLT